MDFRSLAISGRVVEILKISGDWYERIGWRRILVVIRWERKGDYGFWIENERVRWTEQQNFWTQWRQEPYSMNCWRQWIVLGTTLLHHRTMSCKKLLEKTKQNKNTSLQVVSNSRSMRGISMVLTTKLIISVTKFRFEICPETNLYVIFVKRFFFSFFAIFDSKETINSRKIE